MNRTNRNQPSRRRTLVRCVVFVAAVALLLAAASGPQALRIVPSASPFVVVATSVATRSIGLAAIVGLVVLVGALVRRRWFCRWVCPVGLMTECAGRISPVSPHRSKRVPRIGIGLVLLSLSASMVGYPLFVWLDPLAIFSGTLGLVDDFSAVGARVAAAGLAGLLVLSFLLPGVWCLKLCPLGATQELLAIPSRRFRRQRIPDEESDPESTAATPSRSISRRRLLTTSIGGVCGAAGVSLGLAARARGDDREATVLRPPGAAVAWQFGQLCVRCGNCIRSCPSGILRSRWKPQRWSDWLTPEVVFESDYCREGCTACVDACPSGALTRLPGGVEGKSRLGLAQVLMDRCLLAVGRECRTMCLESCPYDAITLHEWSWEDDRRYPIVAADRCPGCGACQVVCKPMDAIVVRPIGSDVQA